MLCCQLKQQEEFMNRVKLIFFLLCIISSFGLKAVDTLKVNLKQADSLFLANNFYLLASSMHIEAQKALVIQARTYPNPVFTADLNAYDPVNERAFHIGADGQKVFQLEQLIRLGGKRRSEIDMAKTNAAIAEIEFQKLLRELRFRLHSDLFALGQQQFLLNKYNNQLTLLDTILNAYEIQTSKGNIPLKDAVRLKGAYLNLNNDRAELYKTYYETQSQVQILLQTSAFVIFQFTEEEIAGYIKSHSLEELKNEAQQNRPDLLLLQQDKILAQQYLQYQKRTAIPDINLFSSYDQRGGAFNNQVNAGFSIPLPLWDRNRGNIKSARFLLDETNYRVKGMQAEVMSTLQNNYALYLQTIIEYQKAINLYNQDFEVTVKGMTDNFQKRNISILEFVDFFEAYNEVLTELTRIKTQLVLNGEQLNLLVGKDIY